jgi:hypothetical protein
VKLKKKINYLNILAPFKRLRADISNVTNEIKKRSDHEKENLEEKKD